MLALLLIFTFSQSFHSDFEALREGEKILKEFAVKYLKAEAGFYGEYFEYQTYLKLKFKATNLPTLVYKSSSGTCTEDILVIFDNDGQIKSKLKISSQCDHDLSYATYKYWGFQLNLDESQIILDVTKESIKDKSKIDSDGMIIDTEDYGDLEHETSKDIKMYSVSKDGLITEIEI